MAARMLGYVASRDRGLTRRAIAALREHGIDSFDWTQGPPCTHSDEDAKIAVADVNALQRAEFFLLMWWPGMTGAYTELGYALARGIPMIVVDADKRDNVFLRHPNVWHGSFDEAVERLARLNVARICRG